MKVSSYNIGVAAEAFAAGFFARFGYNISVQYGANQPEYDLLVEKDDLVFKVSVKGSQTGSWGLIQSYKKSNVTYHEAADMWANTHGSKTIICLVQFSGTNKTEAPRIYLAYPGEIADRLKCSRNGNGDSILYENHTWKSGIAFGTTEKLPEHWQFSEERINQLIQV